MHQMSMTVNPPTWAEAALMAVLKPEDRETVSGDLLEEYRESIHAGANRNDADWRYVREVVGFVWRATWMWGVLLALLTIGRDALDWFAPPASFYTRSAVSTYAHAAIFLAIGVSTAWRGRSIVGAAAAGFGAQTIAVVLIFTTQVLLLAWSHDSQTMAAIAASGGLSESFTLPITVILPGVVLSALGSALGGALRGPLAGR